MKVAEVSLYPAPDAKHVMNSGVASYTKNLLQGLSASKDMDFYVICERLPAVQSEYNEDGVRVLRSFDRSPGFIVQLYKQLKRLKPDVIHLQQELALYGGPYNAYLLSWLLRALRHKRTIVTFHQVVDQSKIDKKFVTDNSSKAPVWLVKRAFRMIYGPTGRAATHVIVHEQYFKDLLVDQYHIPARKISVIPHGVEDMKTVLERPARQKLGLPEDGNILLFMGYLAGYKGIDLLLEGFAEYAKIDPKAFLVIGAGKHPKLLNDEEYLALYESKQRRAKELIPAKQYVWQGFIDEADISQYYSAADVSIYPYSISMSSSGPMAIAIGHEKPFLGSDVFKDVLPASLLFKKDPGVLREKLNDFFTNPQQYQGLASHMKKDRLWSRVGENTSTLYRELLGEE